jgi:HD-GYP domain-containing protein (c-di-GMP phosphodiesterase class II)
MGYDTSKCFKLGVAAFLENIGMYRIPDHILTKKEKLTASELEAIREHPEAGAEIIRKMGVKLQWVADVALQTHERWDGSGYPRGLKGDAISEFASIIGLMDTYMAMTRNRPHRRSSGEADTAKLIIGSAKKKFPPKVVKGFLSQISLYPVNTYVKLNNGAIGRVVSTDAERPMRPTIELVRGPSGEPLFEPETVVLGESNLLRIMETIDAKDFSH